MAVPSPGPPRTPLHLPSPSAWVYRVEGGQKMVFALRDPSSCPPLILCLYSADAPPPHLHVQPLFARHLAPYLQPSRIVTLPRSYLNALVSAAQPHRPPLRRSTTYHPHSTATLLPDAARHFGPSTFLVELKPKGALLSRSRLIPPNLALALRKFISPPYHAKHYLPHGSVPSDAYYPSDLLSADLHRMTRAVGALLRHEARGLRVFDAQSNTPWRADNVLKHPPARQALDVALAALVKEPRACHGICSVQTADYLDVFGAEAIMLALVRRIGMAKAQQRVRDVMTSPAACEAHTPDTSADSQCALADFYETVAAQPHGVVVEQIVGIDQTGCAFDRSNNADSDEGSSERMISVGGVCDADDVAIEPSDHTLHSLSVLDTVWTNGNGVHTTGPTNGVDNARLTAQSPDAIVEDEYTAWRGRITYESAAHGAKLHNDANYEAALRAVADMPVHVMVSFLADFLQAATAKDCSLLVAVAPSQVEPDIMVGQQGWRYKVWVVDVGEKDIRKILGKWPQRERQRAEELSGA